MSFWEKNVKPKMKKITIIIFVHFTCRVRLKKYVYKRDVKFENVK